MVAAVARNKVRLEPPRGRFLAEVNVPGIEEMEPNADSAAYLRRLSDVLANYRVERGSIGAKLIRKAAGKQPSKKTRHISREHPYGAKVLPIARSRNYFQTTCIAQ